MKSESNACSCLDSTSSCPSVNALNKRFEQSSVLTVPSVAPWTNQIAVGEFFNDANSSSVGVSPPRLVATSKAGQLIIAALNKFGYLINIRVVIYPPAEHPETYTFLGSIPFLEITSWISLYAFSNKPSFCA